MKIKTPWLKERALRGFINWLAAPFVVTAEIRYKTTTNDQINIIYERIRQPCNLNIPSALLLIVNLRFDCL